MTTTLLLVALLASAPPKSAPPAPPPPPPAAPVDDGADRDPPSIEDFAIAAENPNAAPNITARITDATGVERAIIYYRALPAQGARSYEQLTLTGGKTGLFIARLPDGLQRTGFEYYVEVHDAAGNPPATLGSADQPFLIEGATQDTLSRLKEEEALQPKKLNPMWPMAAFGIGVLAGAGSAAFFVHYGLLNSRDGEIVRQLGDTNLDANTRNALLKEQQDANSYRVTDLFAGGALGVAGVVGLVTGAVLLVVSEGGE